MKWAKRWLLLGVLLCLGCSSEAPQVRATYEAFLKAFQNKDYATMWKLLSSEQKRLVEEQLETLKKQTARRVLLYGLVELKKEEIQKLTPEEYYKRIVQAYRQILQEKPEAREIFDLEAAVVEKVEVHDSRAVVTLFDGLRRRKVQLLREGDKWKVDEEYVYVEKEEEHS